MGRGGSNKHLSLVGEGNIVPNCNDKITPGVLLDGFEQNENVEWDNIECENIEDEKDDDDASSNDIKDIKEEDIEDDEYGYESEDDDDDASSEDIEEEKDGLGLEGGHIEDVRRFKVFYRIDKKPFFMLGQSFGSKRDVVEAIDNYAIMNSVPIKLIKNERKKVSAKYEKGCPFYIYPYMGGR